MSQEGAPPTQGVAPIGAKTLPTPEATPKPLVKSLPFVEPPVVLSFDQFLSQTKEHGYSEGEIQEAYTLFVSNINQEVTNAVRTAIINADNKERQVLDTEDIQSVLKMHKTFCNLPEATTITEK